MRLWTHNTELSGGFFVRLECFVGLIMEGIMNIDKIVHALGSLQTMAEKCGAEVNISPKGISLWTSDASDFTCQEVSPDRAIKAMKAIKGFRKYWELKS